jgi:hypothetical protein
MHPDKIWALCSPDDSLEHTVSLVKKAMEAEPFFDVQLAELLLGRSSQMALDQPSALRLLEVLDRVSVGTRLLKAESRDRANMLEALWESRAPECLKVFALYRDDGDSRVAGNVLYGLYLRGQADAIPGVIGMASHRVPRFCATAA